MMPSSTTAVLVARILLGVVAATVAVLMLGPFQGAEKLFLLSDKEAHTSAFFALTALAMLASPKVRRNDIALAAVSLAIASEVAQAMVGRDGDIADAVADTIGVLMAVVPTHIERLRAAARGERNPRRRRSDTTAVEIEVAPRQLR